MTPEELKKEARKEAFDYMVQGYSGGKDGLRCSECDNKFSGIANIVQLCPACFVEKYIDRATLAERKRAAEIARDYVNHVITDSKDRASGGAWGEAIAQDIEAEDTLNLKK